MHYPHISDIRIDLGTQPRTELDYTVIRRYADAMLAGEKFPPMTVFYDGHNYILADGFLRYHAYMAVPGDLYGEHSVQVIEGSLRSAQIYACTANKRHGLPRSDDDVARILMFMLGDEKISQWDDGDIAHLIGLPESRVVSARKASELLAKARERARAHYQKKKRLSRRGRKPKLTPCE